MPLALVLTAPVRRRQTRLESLLLLPEPFTSAGGIFLNVAHYIAATHPFPSPPKENGPYVQSLFESSRVAGLGFVS